MWRLEYIMGEIGRCLGMLWYAIVFISVWPVWFVVDMLAVLLVVGPSLSVINSILQKLQEVGDWIECQLYEIQIRYQPGL